MPLDLDSRPNKLPWPPMIYLAAAGAALVMDWRAPAPWGMTGWPTWIGWLVAVAGVGLDIWAMQTMLRAHTNILPNRAADRLVESGPFALTRNPIYAGNTILMIGVGVAWNSLWFIAFAFAAAALTQQLAIKREEAHLALRFGERWERYAARVPRWFGMRRAA